jgi:hypothetical protein
VAVKYLDADCDTQGHWEWLAEVFFLGQRREEGARGPARSTSNSVFEWVPLIGVEERFPV